MAEISINYPPDFKVRYGYGKQNAHFIEAIFRYHDSAQHDFAEKICSLKPFFDQISFSLPENDTKPRWFQPWFPPLDGMSIYTAVSNYKPKTLIEIGSGNSTKFIRQAINDYLLSTILISIDPHPRSEIDTISDRIYRIPLEQSELSLFESLEENDIVFFDGSHRCLQNSDVTVFFIDVLPRIKKKILIGIHDIFWPNDYPQKWVEDIIMSNIFLGHTC